MLTAPPNLPELSSLHSVWPRSEILQASLLPEPKFFLGCPRHPSTGSPCPPHSVPLPSSMRGENTSLLTPS